MLGPTPLPALSALARQLAKNTRQPDQPLLRRPDTYGCSRGPLRLRDGFAPQCRWRRGPVWTQVCLIRSPKIVLIRCQAFIILRLVNRLPTMPRRARSARASSLAPSPCAYRIEIHSFLFAAWRDCCETTANGSRRPLLMPASLVWRNGDCLGVQFAGESRRMSQIAIAAKLTMLKWFEVGCREAAGCCSCGSSDDCRAHPAARGKAQGRWPIGPVVRDSHAPSAAWTPFTPQ
jgi:hypothetical protein